MLQQKRKYFRNRLDLSDHVQVKVVRRRLRLSETDFNAIVERVGTSIACISKEVALQRAKTLRTPADVPGAAVIDAASNREIAGEATPANI